MSMIIVSMHIEKVNVLTKEAKHTGYLTGQIPS